MAQMNRNVNLEEIDSDALLGIDALKNQTMLQKIIFFGCVLCGVVANVALPLLYETPTVVCVFIFLAFLLVGVAFGCNYTEDMTYGQFFYRFFFKPTKVLLYESTEDKSWTKKRIESLRREEEEKLNRQKAADPVEQRKLLMKLIYFVIAMVVLIAGVFIYSGTREEEKHHTVTIEEGEG